MRHTSFTPSAQICGFAPRRPNSSIAAAVRNPCDPSARTVSPATMSFPASKVGSFSPSRPRPRSPVRTPSTRPCWTRSFVADVSGSTTAPTASACSARKRPRAETESTRFPWLRIVGGGGMRTADLRVSTYTASPGTSPYVGKSAVVSRPRKSSRNGEGFTTAPERRCEPGCLPFSRTAIGTSPNRSRTSGCSSSSCPSRMAQARPPGPPPTIAMPTSIRSSAPSVGGPTASIGPNGGAKSIGRATAPQPRARTSSVSFGTISCRSPTTPTSQKSKIGAFGSLLIATMVPDPCMPTLCWIAPEIPQAM